jgi:hypothetical protein
MLLICVGAAGFAPRDPDPQPAVMDLGRVVTPVYSSASTRPQARAVCALMRRADSAMYAVR